MYLTVCGQTLRVFEGAVKLTAVGALVGKNECPGALGQGIETVQPWHGNREKENCGGSNKCEGGLRRAWSNQDVDAGVAALDEKHMTTGARLAKQLGRFVDRLDRMAIDFGDHVTLV